MGKPKAKKPISKKRQEKYALLEQLVKEYQDGSKQAAEELIQHFHHFLMRYVTVITEGKIDFREKYIRKYIELYMIPADAKNASSYSKSPHAALMLYYGVNHMMKLFRHCSKDEIYNECVIAFLEMAARYQQRNGLNYFHTYVVNWFNFRLYHQLKKISNTNVLFKKNKYISYHDDDSGMYHPIHELIEAEQERVERQFSVDREFLRHEIKDGEELNENWISGFQTGELFQEFTKMERRILKLYYVDEKHDEQIGDMMGLHRGTIARKRLGIKNRIKEKLIENRRLKGEEVHVSC